MNSADNLSLVNIHSGNSGLNPESDFVAGISPQYWAYTRMSVMDVLNLNLKNGINWLSNTKFSTPVSKCLVVGNIVYAAERRGGCMVYILDDGTGQIDCVHWSENKSLDPYYLPSLTEPIDIQEDFQVGDPVQVFGKIECLATTSAERIASDKTVIREIHVRIIEPLEDNIVSEARHWNDFCHHNPVSLHSCLDALGPQIRSQIRSGINLPAADDKSSSWRVFGTNCTCNLSYMEDLLYCHCQCKTEPLDPSYRFRDALLHTLLSMQSLATGKLQFKYKEMRNKDHLQKVATQEIIACEQMERNQLIDKLFLKTFRALRCDGIIYLLNSNTDEYFLITRSKALEPFIKSQMIRGIDSSKTAQNFVSYEGAPSFISRVHNERLSYIKRLLNEQKEIR